MKSAKYLPALRSYRSAVSKRASLGERVLGSLFPSRGTGWPGGWSQDRMEQVLHMRNWVFVAVDLICSKMASILPNMAYVVDSPGTNSRRRHGTDSHGRRHGTTVKACQRFGHSFGQEAFVSDGGHSFLTMGAYRSKALSVVKPHEELEPLESDHPLRRLIENPNPVDTSFDLLYEMQMFDELCGVDYLWVVPNRWGQPCELWVIPSHWVWPRTGGGKYVDPDNPHSDQLINYYEVRPWGGMGSAGMLRLPPDEVVVSRWKSPINKIDGYSRLAAIAQWIDSEESISKSRWSQFQNQARPEFWVELGPGYEDPNDDRIARIEAKFMAKIQGEYNYGKPVITPPGAKITPLSFSPTEMAYFQSEDQVRDMILSTFRVPPAAVGIVKEMTYGSILATLSALCTYCLNPRLAMRGLTLTKHLASRYSGSYRDASHTHRGDTSHVLPAHNQVRLWWDDCVPADPSQVNSDMQVDGAFYALTPNEVRAIRGRKPYRAGGDDPIAQGPGGVMPFPLNTGEDLSDYAELIQPMMQAASGGGEEGAEGGEGGLAGMLGGAGPGGEGGTWEGTEGTEDVTEGIEETGDNLDALGDLSDLFEPGEAQEIGLPATNLTEDAGIENPNRKPRKGITGYPALRNGR